MGWCSTCDGGCDTRGMNMNRKRAHGTATAGRLAAGSVVAVSILMVVAPAFGQVTSKAPERRRAQRVVLVSIADRRLAVVEDGNVLADFPVAVGATISPS